MRVRLRMAETVQRRFLQHRAPDCGRDLRMFLPSTSPEATRCVSPLSDSPVFEHLFFCPALARLRIVGFPHQEHPQETTYHRVHLA